MTTQTTAHPRQTARFCAAFSAFALAASTLTGATARAESPPTAPPAARPPAPAASAAPTLKDILARADVAYTKRNMKDSQTAMHAAQKLAPADFEVLWRLARHHFTIASKSSKDGVKKQHGELAWSWADKAIKAKPNDAAGYYWATCGVGEYSVGAGLITAIRKGIASKFERYARAAIKRSKTYEQGGGFRALGRFYFELPWPKRDVEKSIELLREAVKYGPTKARNYAWLAESLIKDDEDKAAKEVLTQCLAKARPAAEDYVDGVQWKRTCKSMLAKL